MNNCFTCLNCGKNNSIKGNSYTNKYCNNSCQNQHRSRLNLQEWKQNPQQQTWKQVPEWVKKHLIQQRGHVCSVCSNSQWRGRDIPLVIDYADGNAHNYEEENLTLVCPNCRAQK